MTPQTTELLLDALKHSVLVGEELPLYRAGKQDGLFSSRTSANDVAAKYALSEGLLELVRTETRGKSFIEFVRATPKAIEWLHARESPVQALRELRTVLEATREGIPTFLAEIRVEWQNALAQLQENALAWSKRLEILCGRVDDAIYRAESGTPTDATATYFPWASDALMYLDRRRESGVPGNCPFPDLFTALRHSHPDLSVPDFHQGLRYLHERRGLRLLPTSGEASDLPKPEFALVEGAVVMYFVAR
jgi:hypothetical protein